MHFVVRLSSLVSLLFVGIACSASSGTEEPGLSASTGVGGSEGGELGSGGAATGGAPTGGTGAGAAPATGGSDAGSGGAPSDCTPNASGTFAVNGDVVFDEVTCLTWMKANTSGDPYAEAIAYCEALDLGGYQDWRIPTAGEAASIFTCDPTWEPIDLSIFTVTGDGFWTSTETGTIAGNDKKVCGAGQSSGTFYDFGPVGGQNTRCVRGPVTLADWVDCKSNSAICP